MGHTISRHADVYIMPFTRSLDDMPATMDVLREVVAASEGKLEVFMDGGIRSGSDVFKALAYGEKIYDQNKICYK